MNAEDRDDIFVRSSSEDELGDDSGTCKTPSVTPLPLWKDIPQTTDHSYGPHHETTTTTRIALMSDTHGRHRQVPLPARADVLIHAGDMTLRGEPGTYEDLADYFTELLHTGRVKRIILIAGNHDVTLQPSFYERQQRYAKKRPFEYEEAVQRLKASCTYLEDESCTLDLPNQTSDAVPAIRVYGSPWSPKYGDWAFTKEAADMDDVWRDIPTDTDILITHGPPYGRGDTVHHHDYHNDTAVGCPALLRHVQTRVRPRLHAFGHIHEGRGFVGYDGHTLSVNACQVDRRYRVVTPSVVVDVPHHRRDEPVRWVRPVSPVRHDEATSLQAFLEWLDTKDKDEFEALADHLRHQHADRDPMEDEVEEEFGVNWREPWESLQDLEKVYCALNMHRDKALQEAFRQSISALYADSFGSYNC